MSEAADPQLPGMPPARDESVAPVGGLEPYRGGTFVVREIRLECERLRDECLADPTPERVARNVAVFAHLLAHRSELVRWHALANAAILAERIAEFVPLVVGMSEDPSHIVIDCLWNAAMRRRCDWQRGLVKSMSWTNRLVSRLGLSGNGKGTTRSSPP